VIKTAVEEDMLGIHPAAVMLILNKSDLFLRLQGKNGNREPVLLRTIT